MKKFSRILFLILLILFIVCAILVYLNQSIPFLSFKYWFSIFCLAALFIFLIFFAIYAFGKRLHGGKVFLLFLGLAVISTGVGYIGGMEDGSNSSDNKDRAIIFSEPLKVTTQGFSNAFQVSADGNKIVYFAPGSAEGNNGIWVADLSDDLKVSNEMMVDESTSGTNWNARWISDKYEFTFTTDRNKFWDVAKYSLNDETLDDIFRVTGGLVISNLAFVPSNDNVYYIETTFDDVIVSHFIKDTIAMDNPEILFEIETTMVERKQISRYLDVSPNTEKFAYTKFNFDNGITELYVYDTKTKKEMKVSEDKLIVFDPKWSPDNEKLLFAGYKDGGKYGLYLYNTNTDKTEKITDDNRSNSSPNWCNGGEGVIYLSASDDDVNIYAMKIE